MQFKRLIMVSLASLSLVACNNGQHSSNINTSTLIDMPSKSSASGIVRSSKQTNALLVNEVGSKIDLHYVTTAGSDVVVLDDDGNVYKLNQSDNVFKPVNRFSSVNKILYLSSFNDTVYLSGESGVIYSTNNNFETIESLYVGKDVSIYGVTFASNKGFAVGYNGNILMKDADATHWDNVNLGGYTLYSITSDNDKNIVAVGNSGTIWLSKDNGLHWNKIVVKDHNGKAVSSNLYQVEYINGDFFIAGDNATLLHSKDLGTSWSVVNFQNTNILNKHFKSVTTVWSNNLYRIIAVGTHGLIVSSDDNGRNWSIENSDTTEHLLSSDCTSGGTQGVCYAVSHENIYVSKNKGLSWFIESIERPITVPGIFSLELENNRSPSSLQPNSTYLVKLSLSDSINVWSPVITSVTISGYNVTLLDDDSCGLTSINNSCLIKIQTHGGNHGYGYITATAAGYLPITYEVSYNFVR